jgi:hypothetical protein
MLFLFKGRHGPVVRAVVGAILLVVGVTVYGGALLAGIGVVLVIWGGIGALSSLRVRRHGHIANGGRMS